MSNFFKKIFKGHDSDIEGESVCPYCKKVLEQKPTRKKKCPFCQNYIYVRTLPSNRKKALATEEEAKKIDTEWAKIGRRQNRLRLLDEVGISENDFIKRTHKSIEEASDQEIKDVVWAGYNQLALKYAKSNDFGALKTLYYRMALFLNEERKDFFQILQQSAKMDLLSYRQSEVVKKVEILTCGENSCESCQRLAGKKFTIEEALEKMPIPNKECTFKLYDENRGFCRCCYIAELKENIFE